MASQLNTPLTQRETQILQQLDTGASAKVVAYRLGISVHTVNQHLRQIYVKLQVHNRVAALNQGRRLGVIAVDALLPLPQE